MLTSEKYSNFIEHSEESSSLGESDENPTFRGSPAILDIFETETTDVVQNQIVVSIETHSINIAPNQDPGSNEKTGIIEFVENYR